MICRILYRFVAQTALKDERSDDEEEEEDEDRADAITEKEQDKPGRAKLLTQIAPAVHLNGEPVATTPVEEHAPPQQLRSRRKG